MNTDRCQYGEEQVILDYFGRKRDGLVVDVGAGDGVTYSNSRFLIRDYGWRGVLIEPDPESFGKLGRLYTPAEWPVLINAGAAAAEGVAMLYPSEMASTFMEDWKAHSERVAAVKYGQPVSVRTAPLTVLLDEIPEPRRPTRIDFLSVDCEGMDLEVLRSLDLVRYPVELLCYESGEGAGTDSEFARYLSGAGFVFHANTRGNTFWRRA